VGTTKVATSWMSTLPHDGNNAAQTSGSLVITVPAGGSTVTERAMVRSKSGTGNRQEGAGLILTRIV